MLVACFVEHRTVDLAGGGFATTALAVLVLLVSFHEHSPSLLDRVPLDPLVQVSHITYRKIRFAFVYLNPSPGSRVDKKLTLAD